MNPRIRKVIALMQEDLSSHLTLSEVASRLHRAVSLRYVQGRNRPISGPLLQIAADSKGARVIGVG